MDTVDKIKKSWWVIFPFTFLFPGVGFIYIGLKASNRNWILEGITYELPWFFYIMASFKFSSQTMVQYYGWIILLACFIALIRSIMVAIKLLDVYDNHQTVQISQVSTAPGSNGSSSHIEKVKDNSKLSACCACIIFIFIVFGIISIL